MASIIGFTLGDHSGDGHNLRKNFVFYSSHSPKDVVEAYKKGCEIIGFDFTTLCDDFEEAFVPLEFLDKLMNAWINIIPGRTENDFKENVFFFDHNHFQENINVVDFDRFCGPRSSNKSCPENDLGFTKFYNITNQFLQYTSLYIAVVQVGNPTIQLEEVCNSKIHIGGYGLFLM